MKTKKNKAPKKMKAPKAKKNTAVEDFEPELDGIDADESAETKPKRGRKKKVELEKLDPEELSLHGKPVSLSGLGFKRTEDGSFKSETYGDTVAINFAPGAGYRVVIGDKLEIVLPSLQAVQDTLKDVAKA